MIVSRTRRRAMAPLELAMLFPLLMILVVAVVWAGKAGSARTAALADARGQAWAQRPAAQPGTVLKLEHKPLASVVEQDQENPLKGKPIFSQQAWIALAYSGTTFAEWAHQVIEFARLPKAEVKIIPHMELLVRFGERNPETLSRYSQLVAGVRGSPAVHPMKNGSVRRLVEQKGEKAVETRLEAQGILTNFVALEVAMIAAEVELLSLATKASLKMDYLNAAKYTHEAAVVAKGILSLPRLASAHGVGK